MHRSQGQEFPWHPLLAAPAMRARQQLHSVWGHRGRMRWDFLFEATPTPGKSCCQKAFILSQLHSHPSPAAMATAGAENSQQHFNRCKYLSTLNILFKHRIFQHPAPMLLGLAAHPGLLTVGLPYQGEPQIGLSSHPKGNAGRVTASWEAQAWPLGPTLHLGHFLPISHPHVFLQRLMNWQPAPVWRPAPVWCHALQ